MTGGVTLILCLQDLISLKFIWIEKEKNMKWFKWFVFTLVLIFVAWIATPRNTDEMSYKCSSNAEALYVTSEGEVTDAIVKLLGLTGIRIEGDSLKVQENWPEPRIYLKTRRLEEVLPLVQGKIDPSITWFGGAKKERWEEDPKKLTLSISQAREITKVCFDSLKLGEKKYSTKKPKAILFLGATLSSVRQRLAYLNELYELKKLSQDLPVYILTGERKLDEAIGETPASLMNADNGIISFRQDWIASQEAISDEGEMINLVFSQSRHKDLHEKNIVTVYSLKGEGRRATTESTVIQWLKEYSPSAGDYLAISHQPYNFYQECVIRRVLLQAGRTDICVEVVGSGLEMKIKDGDKVIEEAKNLLNNISRILYELLIIEKNLKK